MKHDSRYGTTCWICGHVGLRTKKIEKTTYQSCDDCRLAKGSIEEIRAARNVDVEGLAVVAAGIDYHPVYWTPFRFQQILHNNWGLPIELLRRFNWQPYQDSTWEGTKARAQKGSKLYAKEFYAKLRQRKRDGVEKSIQEIINGRSKRG